MTAWTNSCSVHGRILEVDYDCLFPKAEKEQLTECHPVVFVPKADLEPWSPSI